MTLFITLFAIVFNSSALNLVETSAFLKGQSGSDKFLQMYSQGIESFGGGDTLDLREHTTWFYGNKQIKICSLQTKNFGLSDVDVAVAINESINTWKKYFSDKKISVNANSSEKINNNFVYQKNCSGDEDLILYLGTGPIINNLSDLKKRQRLSNPIAFVNRTHISDDLTWSKGYIRFVKKNQYAFNGSYPNWNSNNFKIMLIHELGHILGFQHTNETIMSGNISQDLFILNRSLPVTVDQGKELQYCNDCDFVFTNNNNKIYFSPNANSIIFEDANGLQKKAEITDSVLNENSLNLLSFFQTKAYVFNTPKLFFLNLDNDFLILEINYNTALIRQNGKVVAEYFLDGTTQPLIQNTPINQPTPSSTPSLSLLQEDREIYCSDTQKQNQVLVDKRDRYFYINGELFKLVEFLDSAILAQSESGKGALFQLSGINANVVVGDLVSLKEQNCHGSAMLKTCSPIKRTSFNWSPTALFGLDVTSYGTYPNDGTYFIAEKGAKGAAIIDFGAKLNLVSGDMLQLSCEYK